MLLGFYTGVSGIHYNEQKLSVIANNLANTATPGFKQSLLQFRTRDEHSQTKWIDSAARERLPSFYGVERGGVFKNFSSGDMQFTDSDMDVAIPSNLENAFFAVRRADSNDQSTYYTRNGTLSFGPSDPKDPASPPALYVGGHVALDGGGQPISIDPSAGSLTITPEGELKQGEDIVGDLPLFRFNKSNDPTVQVSSNLQALQQSGQSLFKIPEGLKGEFNPKQLEAGIDAAVLLNQGYREGSNVNVINELMHMMTTTKGSQANLGAFRAQTDSLTKLFQLVRS